MRCTQSVPTSIRIDPEGMPATFQLIEDEDPGVSNLRRRNQDRFGLRAGYDHEAREDRGDFLPELGQDSADMGILSSRFSRCRHSETIPGTLPSLSSSSAFSASASDVARRGEPSGVAWDGPEAPADQTMTSRPDP